MTTIDLSSHLTRINKIRSCNWRNTTIIEFEIWLVGFVRKPLHYPPSRKGIMKWKGVFGELTVKSMPDSLYVIRSLQWAFDHTINGFNGVSIMVAVCRACHEGVHLEWQGLLTNHVENVGFTEMRSSQGSGRMCTWRFVCCPAEYWSAAHAVCSMRMTECSVQGRLAVSFLKTGTCVNEWRKGVQEEFGHKIF